jgi:isocitrate/isopropylmalate dehydrogenase
VSAPSRFRIAAIPADGVGKEVVAAGRQVLDASPAYPASWRASSAIPRPHEAIWPGGR